MTKEKEPNFFIVGAAKSGTTSLVSYLEQHPDIFFSPVKEPFYFVSNFGMSDHEEYRRLFRGAGARKVIGEATTGYLYDKTAASSIKKNYPEAKIVIILRDPVEMAFSFWRYMRVAGNEKRTFEDAIAEKEVQYRKSEQFRNTCSGWYANYLYLERAKYSEQIECYIEVFGRDSVMVIFFEEFISYPEVHCRNIFKFLEIDETVRVSCSKVVNEGGDERFGFVSNLRNRKYPILRKLFPKSWRAAIRRSSRIFNTKKGEKPVLDPCLARRLRNGFLEDVSRLETILGKDLSIWKPKET